MLCKKCGSTIEQTETICQKCGESQVATATENKVIPVLIIIVLIAIISLASYYVIAKDNKPAVTEPTPPAPAQQIDLTQMTQEVEEVEEVEEIDPNLTKIDLNSPLVLELVEYLNLFNSRLVKFLPEFQDISQIDTKLLMAHILDALPHEYSFNTNYMLRSPQGIENHIHSYINEDINFTGIDYSEVPISSNFVGYSEEFSSFHKFDGGNYTTTKYEYEITSVLQDDQNNLIHIDVIEYIQDFIFEDSLELDSFVKYYHPDDIQQEVAYKLYESTELIKHDNFNSLPAYRYTLSPTNSGFTLISKVKLWVYR